MNEITTLNPDDARLTRQLVFESPAATSAHESTRIRNICYGSGVVVAAVGISLAALVWAWNQHTDPEMLKAALADLPPIQVETTVKSGEVTLKDGGVVAMRDGVVVMKESAAVGIDPAASVALADGSKVLVDGTVSLEPGATVAFSGDVTQPVAPRPDIAAQPTRTEDGEAIKREVTVFSSVPFADGSVHTGWNYANGKAKVPNNQFCYFTHPKAN
jgi:hypothetical protein